MSKIKETDLFFPLKEWLEQGGYTVYSEISPWSSNRVDIVGIQGGIVAVFVI